ncbi:MAG TPA: response regulator transcription factor [Chryseosolibacter sp.]
MKIVLADNQELTAAGLSSFLQDRPDFELAAHVSDAKTLTLAIENHIPDLLILDYNLNGFITVDDLEKLVRKRSALNVLILSSDNDKATIMRVLQLGVKGYVTKECSKDEVIAAIQSVSRGEKFYCQKILDMLLERQASAEAQGNDSSTLTGRESEILALIARGKSSQQIADILFLSPHTIQSHRKSIIRKLQIKSPTQFVIHAMDLGLMKAR